MSVEDDKIVRWHPKFRVDDVPDVKEADLPQPPVVKMYNSANDVLEKARDMIAPRVCGLNLTLNSYRVPIPPLILGTVHAFVDTDQYMQNRFTRLGCLFKYNNH